MTQHATGSAYLSWIIRCARMTSWLAGFFAAAMVWRSSAIVISGAFRDGGLGNTCSASSVTLVLSNSFPLYTSGSGDAGQVLGAVRELELDELLVAIDDDAALAREVHDRLIGRVRIGKEHVPPRAAGKHVPDVQHRVRELRKEDARPDVVLDLRLDDTQRDLAEGLVGVRQGDDRDVGGGGHRAQRDHGDRPEETIDAHAACLHGDEFAVGGQPAERDQQARAARRSEC